LNLLELQDKIDTLKAENATLKDDLKKREEALKRLRDLTLGQKAAEQ
jgi:predicted nuclease with TOPRIM domain